ncbi:MAG: hypothetical protein LBH43_11520 [Treponema sp.]|jgi:hypothetical protein|nr:hypothetical protein [Treponema sp.]
MKKMIFLLLVLMLGAGMVFAIDGPSHPPGVNDIEIMAEYSVQQDVVTQPTVLVYVMPATAEQSSFQAVMALYNGSAIQPQSGFIINLDMSMIFGHSCKGCAADRYYLRC